jgi:hypothetical protein
MAILHYHKLENVADPSTSFFISKLIQGIKKQKPSIDSRLPITLLILHKLVDVVDKVCIHPYYKAPSIYNNFLTDKLGNYGHLAF